MAEGARFFRQVRLKVQEPPDGALPLLLAVAAQRRQVANLAGNREELGADQFRHRCLPCHAIARALDTAFAGTNAPLFNGTAWLPEGPE